MNVYRSALSKSIPKGGCVWAELDILGHITMEDILSKKNFSWKMSGICYEKNQEAIICPY